MNEQWKIYTKKGDKGETSLLGGGRVPKYHERVEAYGSLDELNAFIGLLRDELEDNTYHFMLEEIQDRVFTAESLLACSDKNMLDKIPQLHEEDVMLLEKEIDKMNESLPPLNNFILPGGHKAVSLCHIARTVCRRAERMSLKIADDNECDHMVIKYLNRLSDYFFVLARKLAKDFNAVENVWKARL